MTSRIPPYRARQVYSIARFCRIWYTRCGGSCGGSYGNADFVAGLSKRESSAQHPGARGTVAHQKAHDTERRYLETDRKSATGRYSPGRGCEGESGLISRGGAQQVTALRHSSIRNANDPFAAGRQLRVSVGLRLHIGRQRSQRRATTISGERSRARDAFRFRIDRMGDTLKRYQIAGRASSKRLRNEYAKSFRMEGWG